MVLLSGCFILLIHLQEALLCSRGDKMTTLWRLYKKWFILGGVELLSNVLHHLTFSWCHGNQAGGENAMNQVKDSSWVPSCVCLKSRLSAVNRQSGAHWEFIGKPPVKRTVTISLVSAHCTDTPHSLFLSCGHTAERQVGVVLFSDLLVARYAGGCFGMFNDPMPLVWVVWLCLDVCARMSADTLDVHFFPSRYRAETERGLNRKHIIEGNKLIFLSSALSLMSPHHSEPCCSPVISLLYLPPSSFFPPLCLLHSLCTNLNLKDVSANSTWNLNRCFLFNTSMDVFENTSSILQTGMLLFSFFKDFFLEHL